MLLVSVPRKCRRCSAGASEDAVGVVIGLLRQRPASGMGRVLVAGDERGEGWDKGRLQVATNWDHPRDHERWRAWGWTLLSLMTGRPGLTAYAITA